MDPVQSYLEELRDIRVSGATVPETSGYGAALLDVEGPVDEVTTGPVRRERRQMRAGKRGCTALPSG